MTHGAVALDDLRDARSGPAARTGSAFRRFAWGSLIYTVFVILFGAVVRITGSGAGCGQHWPSCNGEIAHLPQSIETAIELTHRVTSGVSLLLAVALVVFAVRRFERGHTTRIAAFGALGSMLVEALIGAALVLLELVGNDDSLARAGVMAAHLVNTSLLTCAMTITAWSAGKQRPLRFATTRGTGLLILGMAAAMLLVSTTGAVTALGDTLYPVNAPGAAPGPGTAPSLGYRFLQSFRALHPILAIVTAAYLSYAVVALRTALTRRLARAAIGLLIVQMAAGVLNILLSAPGWMQVTHLALATALWITLVMLGAEALSAPRTGAIG